MPGIPDDELVRLHWNHGRGEGSSVGLRHRPSGITVTRECAPNAHVHEIAQELIVELSDKLRTAGLVSPDTDTEL
jgi:hypothetical protein